MVLHHVGVLVSLPVGILKVHWSLAAQWAYNCESSMFCRFHMFRAVPCVLLLADSYRAEKATANHLELFSQNNSLLPSFLFWFSKRINPLIPSSSRACPTTVLLFLAFFYRWFPSCSTKGTWALPNGRGAQQWPSLPFRGPSIRDTLIPAWPIPLP